MLRGRCPADAVKDLYVPARDVREAQPLLFLVGQHRVTFGNAVIHGERMRRIAVPRRHLIGLRRDHTVSFIKSVRRARHKIERIIRKFRIVEDG